VRQGLRAPVALAVLLSSAAPSGQALAGCQGEGECPSESRKPPRLRLDIDRHVERVLSDAKAPDGLLRFEEKVEVREPQELLARFLRDEDLRYGPTGSSAPTPAETTAFRPGVTAGANFLPLLQWLLGKARGDRPPRFFLYRVRARGRQWFALYEEKVPLERQAARPDVAYELIDGFPDRESAVAAWRRHERDGGEAGGGGAVELGPPAPGPPADPSVDRAAARP